MKKSTLLVVLIMALAIPALGGGIPPGMCPIDLRYELTIEVKDGKFRDSPPERTDTVREGLG